MRRPDDRSARPALRHGRRVGRLVASLASAAGLPERRARRFGRAARFHDIGKAAVPRALLTKEGALSTGERRIVRLHPKFGDYLLSEPGSAGTELARRVARSHHERWDGSGYPDGLRRLEIPAAARFTAVADALDVMIEGRPYAAPKPVTEALDELRRQAGRHFDPDVVRLVTENAEAVLGVRRLAHRPRAVAGLERT